MPLYFDTNQHLGMLLALNQPEKLFCSCASDLKLTSEKDKSLSASPDIAKMNRKLPRKGSHEISVTSDFRQIPQDQTPK